MGKPGDQTATVKIILRSVFYSSFFFPPASILPLALASWKVSGCGGGAVVALSAIWKDVMMIDLCRRRCAIDLLSSDLTVVWLPAALPGPD